MTSFFSKIRILFALFLFTQTNIASNSPIYQFKHYNINNGLSQNTVFSIFQDNLGFMWFGTKDGLNRFDGTNFKVFKFSPNGILRDNVFHDIIQDRHNKIWVATEDGVYIYNPFQEVFARLNQVAANDGSYVEGVVSDIMLDKDGDIWMAVEDKGIYQYSFSDDKLIFYSIPLVKDGMQILRLSLDNENGIWVFPYSRPFIRIDKKTKQISQITLSDNNTILFNTGEISDVLVDRYNEFLVATSQQGLISVNIVNKTCEVLLDKDEFGQPIFARSIERVDPQTLWIGTESGLYIYNTETGDIKNLRHNNSIPYSLSDNAIYSIYKDRNGGVWIGSYFGGVDYYSNQNSKFELYYPIGTDNSLTGSRVREFCEAPDGKIWIGTEDKGLNLFDPVSSTFLQLPKSLQTLYTNIHALYNDGDFLWISTFSKGLNRYNLKTGELIVYEQSENPNSISHNSTFAIYKDRQNVLWIGTLSGLNIYDYKTYDFTQIDELKAISIHDIFEDSDGKIWISTFTNGLYRFNPNTKKWNIFTHNQDDETSLPYNKVTSVFEDSKKRLWVTTQGGGFSYFDKENETFQTFNSTNGLPNDVVYQIVEDDKGCLWLSTNSGLVRYNSKTNKFKNYTVNNGLKTNQFNYKSSYKTPDGIIYFGSLEGFVRFDPSSFSESESEQMPSIIFTDLFINNNPAYPSDDNSVLKQSILYTDILNLPYNKNSFSLRYAILDYSNLNTGEVLYKLEGFDKEWVEAKGKRDINYSNLKPGKYTLFIKFNGNTDNGQSESVKTLIVKIQPPFWRSTLAYFIYIVLIIISLIALLRYLDFRSKRIQRRKMRIFEQQKERELYQSKIDFFTNVAHEIRTPLSLIKAPLDYVIMTENVSDNVKENLQIMSKNTDRLLNLTNQLLDFRKTESKAYTLNLETHNVSEIIRETFLRFSPVAKQKNLTFELDLPGEDIFVQLDKEAFLKIVSNLVNNAIKYCDSFVRVKAYLTNTDGQNTLFHMVIENDGEKIPVKFKDEIFKPFVHLDKENNQKVVGTGIGLALSLSLAELHKGSLHLEDRGEFTYFHLTLPVGNRQKEFSETEINSSKTLETPKKDTSSPFILLVDDDVELLRFEEKVLSAHYPVLVAENGKQALEIIHNNQVNLIVSDVMMPEMDGFELTRLLKSDIEFSHIPIILLTAKVNVQAKVQGFETGADAYIEKPFSIEVLMAQIANLLQNREKLRETFLKHPFIGASSIAITKSDEEFIKKLYNIVQENISNPDFVVEDIAEQFNMSRASFYRKIKGILDLTPNEYIRVERLKKAAQLLKENEYKVNEICYMVGFNSPSYFSKCFQQQFGVLPKDF